MPDPDHVRRMHHYDQLTGIYPEIAPLLRSFFDALLDEGFTRQEALALTEVMLEGLLRMPTEEE